MKVEIKNGKLLIEAPVKEVESKSGKSILLATFNSNQVSGCEHKGKPVVISLAAYIKK